MSVYIINIGAAILSFALWFLFVTRGDPWVRARVAKAFGITITRTGRGLWRVTGARSSALAIAVELLQPAMYFTVFMLWGLLMVLVVVASVVASRG